MDFFHILSLFVRCVLLIGIPVVALAEDLFLNTHPYSVSLDFGIAQPTNLGNASVLFPVGYSTFIYDSNHNSENTSIVGLSLNRSFTINPLYQWQVGLSYHYISPMNVTGDLAQGISPPYYQSTYSYTVTSSQYLVETKLQRQFSNRYAPYAYLGLGLASNRAYHYATSVPDYLVTTPDYQNKTTNAFTYSLGCGFDYFVAHRLSVGLGYRFTDLGAVGLGSGNIRNTQIGAELKQSHLYMNTVLAQLTYFI